MSELWLQAFKRLPERFRKPNTKDLYYVLYGGYGEIEKAFIDVMESRNIEKAYGKTLDNLGGNVGQFRQGEDDELYRRLIQVRIIANLSIGNIPTINTVMSALVKEIYLGLEEVWLDDDRGNEPSAIKLNLSEFSKSFPIDLIMSIKSAGVRVLFSVYKEKHQNIYYAMADQRKKTLTIYPNMAEDQKAILSINYGIGTYEKVIHTHSVPVEVWFLSDEGVQVEVVGENEERLIYG